MSHLLGDAFSGQVPFRRKCMLKKLTVTSNNNSKNVIHMTLLCFFLFHFYKKKCWVMRSDNCGGMTTILFQNNGITMQPRMERGSLTPVTYPREINIGIIPYSIQKFLKQEIFNENFIQTTSSDADGTGGTAWHIYSCTCNI